MIRTLKPRTALRLAPAHLALFVAPKGCGRVGPDSVAAQMAKLEAIWFAHDSGAGTLSDFEEMGRIIRANFKHLALGVRS